MAGSQFFATNGGIVEISALTDHQITQEEYDNYHTALQGVRDTVFYSTQQALMDAHENSMDAVTEAIDSFVVATHQIAVVEEVAEKAETAQQSGSVSDQVAVQEFVEQNNVEITQATVDNFNQSLEDIGVNAREAGAFLAAAHNQSITEINDQHTKDFGNSMHEATVSYSATSDSLFIEFADTYGNVSYHGFLEGAGHMRTTAEVLGEGEYIYNQSPMYQ